LCRHFRRGQGLCWNSWKKTKKSEIPSIMHEIHILINFNVSIIKYINYISASLYHVYASTYIHTYMYAIFSHYMKYRFKFNCINQKSSLQIYN
jgi:hypothetical protein